MSEAIVESPFTPGFVAELERQYDPAITRQFTDPTNWRQAEAPGLDGEFINYVDIQPTNPLPGAKPLFYRQGFVGNVENKGPLLAEAAARGYRVVAHNQVRADRTEFAKAEGLNVIDLQALDGLAVLEKADILDLNPTIVTQSMGSLIVQSMIKMQQGSRHQAENTFARSNVALLAPAGMNDKEKLPYLATRWVQFLASQASSKGQDFPDIDGQSGKASLGVISENLGLALAEACKELPYQMIDPKLPSMVGRLAIVPFGKDRMYPDRVMNSHAAELVENGAIYVMPYDSRIIDGEARGVHQAVHDDDQFNPNRVLNTVQEIFGHAVADKPLLRAS